MNIDIKNQDKVKISQESLYSKFTEICEKSNKINYNSNKHIVCPYCQTVIKSNDINNISNFCYITFNNNDDLVYRVFMPCCGTEIYETTTWDIGIPELLDQAREHYRQNFLFYSDKYQKAKENYKTICDIIYETDFLNI